MLLSFNDYTEVDSLAGSRYIEENEEFLFSMLDSVHMTYLAWNAMSDGRNSNSFRLVGLHKAVVYTAPQPPRPKSKVPP